MDPLLAKAESISEDGGSSGIEEMEKHVVQQLGQTWSEKKNQTNHL